jgi:transposase-like protein
MSNITSTAGDVPPTHSARESFWRDMLAAFAASGQSVQSFCQARGVKPPTFYSWRLKLAKHDRQVETGVSPTPARSRATRRRSTGPAFLPVVVEPRVAGVEEPLQVELRGGRVLRLPASMPAARLAEVLHALEGQA